MKDFYLGRIAVYDEKRGDPVNGVRSGTPFAEVPDTWVCPVCGAPKSEFEKITTP